MSRAANLLALVQEPEDAQFADALAMERAVEAARLDAWAAEAERARGACWSGLGPDRFIPASEQQLIERARAVVGGLAVTMGGVDVLVFTAGVGEHSAGRMSDEDLLQIERRAIPDALWQPTLARYPFLARRNDTDLAELRRLCAKLAGVGVEWVAFHGFSLTLTPAVFAELAAQAVRAGAKPQICINGRRLEPHMAKPLFDAELQRTISVLSAFASSAALDTKQPEAFYQSALRLAQAHPNWITVILADPDGNEFGLWQTDPSATM